MVNEPIGNGQERDEHAKDHGNAVADEGLRPRRRNGDGEDRDHQPPREFPSIVGAVARQPAQAPQQQNGPNDHHQPRRLKRVERPGETEETVVVDRESHHDQQQQPDAGPGLCEIGRKAGAAVAILLILGQSE